MIPESCFDFEQVLDSERVLRLGLRRYGGKILYPERWYPEIGCFKSGACAKEVWVRIVGDVCWGFVAVDKDIALRRNMQWARILIRFNVRGLPTSLHEVVRLLDFYVQLWWELPPWAILVELKKTCEGGRTR